MATAYAVGKRIIVIVPRFGSADLFEFPRVPGENSIGVKSRIAAIVAELYQSKSARPIAAFAVRRERLSVNEGRWRDLGRIAFSWDLHVEALAQIRGLGKAAPRTLAPHARSESSAASVLNPEQSSKPTTLRLTKLNKKALAEREKRKLALRSKPTQVQPVPRPMRQTKPNWQDAPPVLAVAERPRLLVPPHVVETDSATFLVTKGDRDSLWLYAFAPRSSLESDEDLLTRVGPHATMLLDIVEGVSIRGSVVPGVFVVKKTAASRWVDMGIVRREWPVPMPHLQRPDDPGDPVSPPGWFTMPAHTQLKWELLPPGWWRSLGADGRPESRSEDCHKRRRMDVSRLQFLDSLRPHQWFSGSHLGSVVYYVALFDRVAIADCVDEGNAIYYVRLSFVTDWRPVLRLSKQEARLAGAATITHRGDWQERVRRLLR